MPITFRPAAGDCLLCEFGPNPVDPATYPVNVPPLAMSPEMYKQRQVAVLSTNAYGDLVTVAPFSTVPPRVLHGYHHFIAAGTYPFLSEDCWLKGDMLMAVSKLRLDRLLINGRYGRAVLRPDDLKAVRECALEGLGLGRLAAHL